MSPEEELRALRQELEKVKEERDSYRRMTQNLMLKLYPLDLKRLEDEVREINETGGIPHEQVIEMIKSRHGIKS
jgi:predicted  nucleic acid-binding Zn-ribbon protein